MADREETDPGVEHDLPTFAGDSLEALYRSHYDTMVRLAAVLLDDDHAAEEVVQDAFIAIDRKLAGVAVGARPAYLRRAVINGARSRARHGLRAKRRPRATRETTDGPEDHALIAADQRRVVEAVAALPARQRECVVLRYYAGLDDHEIAATLDLAAGTVKTHLHRARAALADVLREEP